MRIGSLPDVLGPAVAAGVGHIFDCTCSDVTVLRFIRSFIAMCASGDLLSSRAVGVAHIRTELGRFVSSHPSPFGSRCIGVAHMRVAPASFGSSERSPDRIPFPS